MHTDYDDDYATCKLTFCSLNVYSTILSFDEIDSALELEFDKGFSKGEAQRMGPHKKIWPHSYARITTQDKVDSKDMRRHLDFLLSTIQDAPFATLIDQEKLTANISCYWESKYGQGGPTLSPHQFQQLAQLPLELWFDIYDGADDIDEDEDEAQECET